MTTKQYRVGIYCRVSKDDLHNSSKKNYIPADESVSVENQYEMLSKFCMMNGWVEVKAYRDDGYVGSNFNRPGFQEMLEDARSGKINLILAKDLSRLGRDYIEVERYTTVVFPSIGCRFISVLDSLDNESDDIDMLHFRSLMNDYHLKDLSAKIKSVLHAKRKSGQYLTPYAPYGYRKSDEDKHRLVVDDEAAAVVRRIYDLRYHGMSYSKITALLNKDGIITPRQYWYQQNGKGDSPNGKQWKTPTVKEILKNEIYIGNLIINRIGHRSYKDKTNVPKPEEEWIRHDGTHEAIIRQDVWEAVQRLNEQAKNSVKGNAPPCDSLFRGRIFCADCGSPMYANSGLKHYPSGDKRYISYSCGSHVHSGRSICSPHTISERKLKQIILDEIHAHAEAVEVDEAAVIAKLKKQLRAEAVTDNRQEITALRRRVQELENMTVKLYEDKYSGQISEEAFVLLIQKNEQERQSKAERLDALLSEKNTADRKAADIQLWADTVRAYVRTPEVDRDMLAALVERIEVGEKIPADGRMQQDITVVYRFVGRVE